MMKIEGSTEPSAVDEIWHLREPREGQVGINVENVSDTKGADVRVALCDLGVESTHPGLLNRIDTDRARDFDNTLDPAGLSYEQGRIIDKFDAHGTACAGLVCGVEDPKRATDVAQGKRCVGVAPEAKLVPIRISTNFELRSLIAALKHAEENAHVILLPRVLPRDKELEAELRIVASHVPVVCACGNDGTPQLAYPAALPETIAVGACNNRGYRSTYSQYGRVPETGRQIDVVACSNDIPVEDRELVRLDMEEVGLRELKANGRTDHTLFRTGMLTEDDLLTASAKNG
jgi:subtilisin family serine protease